MYFSLIHNLNYTVDDSPDVLMRFLDTIVVFDSKKLGDVEEPDEIYHPVVENAPVLNSMVITSSNPMMIEL